MTDLITVFTTLFVIIDPIGLVPIFVALTHGLSKIERRRIALRACITATLVLLCFSFFGEALLNFIGISMHAFRISGGVLLFLTAIDMLFQKRRPRREGQASEAQDTPDADPSIFPLAVPLIAGPGAIASIILLSNQSTDLTGAFAVNAVMISVIILVFFMFSIAHYVEKALGKTGTDIITRLLGMLLAALSIQFILDGLKGFGFAG